MARLTVCVCWRTQVQCGSACVYRNTELTGWHCSVVNISATAVERATSCSCYCVQIVLVSMIPLLMSILFDEGATAGWVGFELCIEVTCDLIDS